VDGRMGEKPRLYRRVLVSPIVVAYQVQLASRMVARE
jgi:hypothetical protein